MSTWTLKEKSMGDMNVTIEGEEWKNAVKKAFNKIAKNAKIDGFRKGHVPAAMLEKKVSMAERQAQAIEDNANEWMRKAFEELNLTPISQPQLDVKSMDDEKAELVFTFAVMPEVELGEYKGIEVPKYSNRVTQKEIDAKLEEEQLKNARTITVEGRPVQDKDEVVLDFEGFVDGEAFEGGKGENYSLTIGSNTFIPGFEDQIVGMKTGEEKDVKVKFPDEYFSKDLAGKDATFKVKVNEIKKKELPELDDEFAKDVSEFDTLKELKASIKEKLEKENEERTKYETQDAAVKAVCDNTEIDIPSGMIDSEIDNMVNDMKSRLQYQGLTLENYLKMVGKTEQEFRKDYEEQAKEAVKSRLVIEAIVKAEKIEADDKDVNAKIEEMAKNYGREAKDLEENEALKNYIKGSLETEKAIEFVVKNAKIK